MVRRRTLLRTGVAVGLGGVAGCTLGREGGPGESTPEPTPATGPVTGFNFDGPDLVFGLREGHAVEELNLVSPDGSLFTGAAVETGVTTVRLPLLEIRPVNWTHYTPGVNRLVAVAGDQTWTMDLELRPDLRIVDVSQYRDGTGADFGRVAVDIENVGTGPTWVYQITYEEAPNWTANDELVDGPGTPSMLVPDEPIRSIILPNQSKRFVDGNPPLIFSDTVPTCEMDSIEFSIVAGQPLHNPLTVDVRADVTGDPVSAGLTNEYSCSEINISKIDFRS